MKENIPNVAIASILAEPAGQRKFAGFFAYLGTVHRWNLRILREQSDNKFGRKVLELSCKKISAIYNEDTKSAEQIETEITSLKA